MTCEVLQLAVYISAICYKHIQKSPIKIMNAHEIESDKDYSEVVPKQQTTKEIGTE